MTEQQLQTSQWLNQSYHARKKVLVLSELRKFEKGKATGLTLNIENIGVGKVDSKNNFVELNQITYADVSREYYDAFHKYLILRAETETVLSLISNVVYNEILTRRYLMYQTIEEIAGYMSYSARSIKYNHKQALDKAYEVCTQLHCFAPLNVL